jgi:hypothetical protein
LSLRAITQLSAKRDSKTFMGLFSWVCFHGSVFPTADKSTVTTLSTIVEGHSFPFEIQNKI